MLLRPSRYQQAEEQEYPKELKQPEIQSRVWRQLAWDQLHPRTGKYRPNNYPDCLKWTPLDEQFRWLTPPTTGENRAARSKKWRHWLGGTYTFPYPSGDDCQANVYMTFDWLTSRSMHWTVDTVTADAAYPGKHRGSLIHREDKTHEIEVEWEIPIFSPYVRIQKRDAAHAPVVGISTCEVPDWSKRTTIMCEKKNVKVMVLQNVMKSVCNILVHGPRQTGVPETLASPVKLENKYYSNYEDILELTYKLFQKEARLRKAASFFSRAYNTAGDTKKEREVTSAERQSTIDSVNCLLEHFRILEEPHWMEDDDWAENLERELGGVRTYDAWHQMERKWATLVSYSCGLDLHRGPWAGPDWEKRAV